jgi:deazaflavin-dependent oxidoreductase (nitroreductase family)
MHDNTARHLSRVHRLIYRSTVGRIGRRFVGNNMLLLTTTGRRSGKPHTVPLLYLRDGTDVLVIASWGGRDYPPDWYVNLTADPVVNVRIDGSTHGALAAILDEPERAEWWERFVAAYDGYAAYQSRTPRIIPIIRLEIDQGARPGHRRQHSDGAT